MPESPAAKALRYAEDKLKVNEVYTEALDLLERYEHSMVEAVDIRRRKRECEIELADQEMILVARERGANPEMSEAAMSRHMKVAVHQDEEMKRLRDSFNIAERELVFHESRARVLHQKLQVVTARINELNGYLTYLASIKTSARGASAS